MPVLDGFRNLTHPAQISHESASSPATTLSRLGERPPSKDVNPRFVDITAHSYRSATSARPLASTSRFRARSIRCAHCLAGS